VPIDDYNCWRGTANGGLRGAQAGLNHNDVPKGGIAPRTQNAANDFLIDREKQKTFSYTGILGINQQDMAVTESMGPIYDRTQEHLGTSDAMVIRTRRRVINAARALRDSATVPPGVDDPSVYRYRSGGVILPRDADWLEATKGLRRAFAEPSAEKVAR